MIACLIPERLADRSLELRCVVGNKVCQVTVLGIAPPRFHWIKLRGISRQPFEFDILHPRSQDPLGSRTVNAPTIQHDYEWSTETFPQRLDECDRFIRTNIIRVNLKRGVDALPLRRKCHRTDHTQSIVSVPSSLNGSLAPRRPRFAVHWLQPETRFIEKCDGSTASASFFLLRGQSLFRHRWTAWASCSRATRRGFWGLYPRLCKMRPRWSGWYETRNFLRTTLATRAQVHKSVWNPAATGPAFKITTSSCFWSGDNFGVGPGCGLAANAATPPSCHARFQRFTLERLAPTWRAISARGFRSLKSFAARRRRASSSVALLFVLISNHTVLAHYLVHSLRRGQ